jgi:nicotinamide riboside kinase
MKVALLGAAGTGKTSLARALALALADSSTAPDVWQISDESPLQHLMQTLAGTYPALDLTTALQPGTPEWVQAVDMQRGFEHTLLLALDVGPAKASTNSTNSANTAQRLCMDALIRQTLLQAQIPFQVIYGLGEERLAQALSALKRSPAVREARRKPWVWACDKCSDPACEHRLLSDLLASRQT